MSSPEYSQMLPSVYKRKFEFLHRDAFLLDCPTYQSYLELFVTKADRRYLTGYTTGLKLVKYGYRTRMVVFTPEQYAKRKSHVELLYYGGIFKTMRPLSVELRIEDPVMKQLAQREQPNIDKIISTIIYVKDADSTYHISAYIDFEDSLKSYHLECDDARNWPAIFTGRAMLRPRKSDLSFCHLHTGKVFYNNTDNYNVLHSRNEGLVFMHRGDHKRVCVSEVQKFCGNNSIRNMYFSEKYGYVIVYDHIVRRKV